MGLPRFEVLSGTIDGINKTFTTSVPYTAGTTAAFLGGQLKRIDFEDGWAETDPPNGIITLTEAPETGDVVQAFFLDTSTDPLVEEITPIRGILRAVPINGKIKDDNIKGRVCEVC